MSQAPGFRPLYRQVYDVLVKQIADGVLKPAELLPSEQQLARELNVSQGTVRKALDAMAAEGVVERHQGKGTFVAEHTQERALFRFFRLVKRDGARAIPTSVDVVMAKRAAHEREAQKLGLPEGANVVCIRRTRMIDGIPAVIEHIALPETLYPGLEHNQSLPNALYTLYQQDFGLNIVSTDEALWAESATVEDCERLPLTPGSPVLVIERVAIALEDTRVEYRLSRCDSRHLSYAISLR
jgi:GntR family transcriptional regulator